MQALRDGDEAAFLELVRRHHSMLNRMARMYVADHSVDGLAQAVWSAMLRRLDALADDDSFRVVLLTMLHEQVRHRRDLAARAVPFAAHWDPAAAPTAPVVDPSRFRTGEPWPGHWAASVPEWQPDSTERLLSRPRQARIEREIASLPDPQREVLALRDIEGWTADEVSDALGISDARQRLLLHAARSRLRAALDDLMLEG